MADSKYKTVFLDFDGTLADSSSGIIECVRHSILCAGMPACHEDTIKGVIGPSLPTMIKMLYPDIDQDRFDIMFREYRKHYETAGISGVRLYDGVKDLLAELHGKGLRLFVVSSKPEKNLRLICENFGITGFFDDIRGVDLSKTPASKTDLLVGMIEQYRAKINESVMIGDTVSDIKAAMENRIDSIGVTYGFGTFEEPYIPTYLCHSMDELAACVKQEG